MRHVRVVIDQMPQGEVLMTVVSCEILQVLRMRHGHILFYFAVS